MKIEIINQIYYHIGCNAKENWDLYNKAEPYDIWFHLKDDTSPYVIMEVRDEKIIPYEMISEGAILCKRYSKYRNNNKKIKVIYCEVQYLKKGRSIGEVIIDDKYIKEISV